MMEKIYHVYIKGRCVYPALKREEYEKVCEYLEKIIWVTDIRKEDIEFEELTYDKELAYSSSH
jgi:hypothetical protein